MGSVLCFGVVGLTIIVFVICMVVIGILVTVLVFLVGAKDTFKKSVWLLVAGRCVFDYYLRMKKAVVVVACGGCIEALALCSTFVASQDSQGHSFFT